MAFSMREAVPLDQERIIRLGADARRPARSSINVQEYFVAIVEGQVIGCAGVQDFGSGSYLFGLVVDRAYRRQGIGSALTRIRVERARASKSLFVVVLAMFWNVRFFRSLGFRIVSRRDLPAAVLSVDDFRNPTYRRSAVLLQELGA